MIHKKMKTCLIALLSVSILLMFSQADAATVLRMNHQFPAKAAGSKIDQWFADEIKRMTDGDLQIQIFWNNALGNPKDNLLMLKTGRLDMAAMSAGYFSSQLPFFSAPNSMPMAMDNICQSSAIMKAFMEEIPAFSEEASGNGVRPFFFHLLNPYLLVSKKPVVSFEDLKGMRIRTWGDDLPKLVSAAGARPVPLFLPDLKEAMARGVVDGCPFSVDLTLTYGIHELAKHITDVVIWEGPAWGVWISEKTWEALSAEHQKVIMEASEKTRQKELNETISAGKEARAQLKANGVEFHAFPAGELEKWRSASPDFFDLWIHKMEKTGKEDAARQTVKLWKEMRARLQECP